MNTNSLHEQLIQMGFDEIVTNEVMANNTEDQQDHYMIIATRPQVAKISNACNTMARLELAQFNALLDVLPLKDNVNCWELLKQLEALFKPHLKDNLMLSDYFPMHQAIRHRLSWDRHPEGGMTVNFDEPMKINDEPLILISNLKKKELTQDVFFNQPENINSAHIDANGIAFLNECMISQLKIIDGQHISTVLGSWQKPIGGGYKIENWKNSAINRI